MSRQQDLTMGFGPRPKSRHIADPEEAKRVFGEFIDSLAAGKFDEATRLGRSLRSLGFSVLWLPRRGPGADDER